MVALFSVLVLGLQMTVLQMVAMTIIGCGIISLALVRRADGQRSRNAAVLSLTTGLFIASYSLVDGLGARVAGTAVGFYSWLAIGNGVILILYLAQISPQTRRALPKAGRNACLIGGGASFVAYSIVIWAFTQAPIALVTALRETSIIFALIIDVFFLKERLDLFKVVSTLTALLGAIILRFAK